MPLIIIIILLFIVSTIIDYVNKKVILRRCSRCHEVKKGVYKRNFYVEYLTGRIHKHGNIYLCNECANNKSLIIVQDTYAGPGQREFSYEDEKRYADYDDDDDDDFYDYNRY